MLTPEQAVEMLRERGKMRPLTGADDPTEAGLSYRWWWDGDGNLCGAWWRGPRTVYNVRLHDPDCPQTNNPPDEPCVCDRTQWADANGANRTVPVIAYG